MAGIGIKLTIATALGNFSRECVFSTLDMSFFDVMIDPCCGRIQTFGAMSEGFLVFSLFVWHRRGRSVGNVVYLSSA